jgi:hypothetical protein
MASTPAQNQGTHCGAPAKQSDADVAVCSRRPVGDAAFTSESSIALPTGKRLQAS